MAWTTNPYATLQQVKNALDLQSTSDDVWLQELITEAQSAIDRYVGYPFQTDGDSTTPATRTYDGTGEPMLFIDYCQQLTQVLEMNYGLVLSTGGAFQVGSVQSLDITSDIILGPANTSPGYTLRRRSELCFMPDRQNYVISGIFGIPAIPPDITRACVRLTIHYYKMRDVNYADIMTEQGGVRQAYYKPIPADVIEILQRYKRRLFLAW
jgi:hypothetical protein